MRKTESEITRTIILVVVVFFAIVGTGFFWGIRYINYKMMQSGEENAMNMALLVGNELKLTNQEVEHMMSLDFNGMESDAVNLRMVHIVESVAGDASICNAYVVAPLIEGEQKYLVDENNSDSLGFESGTKLNGIWLLNSKYDSNGVFIQTQRDDIYRYTVLDTDQLSGIESQQTVGNYTKDVWGTFITGYAPIYTVEGNFVGLMGIDMDLDSYQRDARGMITMMISVFAVTAFLMLLLFLVFYTKYKKLEKSQLYFEFYSRMSHDMRTPMNGILGMTALSKGEENVNVLQHNMEMIEESGTYMLSLINDTLDLQRLDAGKMKLNPEIKKSGTMIDNIVAMVKPSMEQKNIHFQIINKNMDLEEYLYVDIVRIKQIFVNILSNAMKFTPEGGTITLVMECLSKNDRREHNRYQVIDTGMGMSEEFVKNKLFKPFEQEKNTVTSQYAGTGLGLSITQKLIDLMNGKIEAHSELGKGTTFCIELDIQTVDKSEGEKCLAEKQKKGADEYERLRGKRILLCEDNTINIEISRRLLEKVGCVVEVAQNGKIGLEFFMEKEIGYYDAILMDMRMPVMDGREAVNRIRGLKRQDARKIPIIAMTANAYEEDVRSSMEIGMNAHLSKPIDPSILYRTLNENMREDR